MVSLADGPNKIYFLTLFQYASALNDPAPFDEESSTMSVCGIVVPAAAISQNGVFDY